MTTNEKVQYWLDLADYDIETARVNLDGKRFLYVGFMCHQTIEKALKAAVTHVTDGGVPPKIHNLLVLNNLCVEHDNRFSEVERACDVLNRYGVQPRYPNELGITENDMRKALEYARQIQGFELLAEIRRETGQ